MTKTWLLDERFNSEKWNDSLQWLNEPEKWSVDTSSTQLVLEPDPKTDYWQKTHYGFENDNGHFLYTATDRNFRMTTKVTAAPKSKYDHAGLMLRYSKDVWVKASLEFITSSLSKLGVVVTNQGYSDWSTQYVKDKEIDLYLRLSKIAQNCYIDFSWDGEEWMQMRIAHLDIPGGSLVSAGLFACSPQEKGQSVRFDFLSIEELSSDPNQAYL